MLFFLFISFIFSEYENIKFDANVVSLSEDFLIASLAPRNLTFANERYFFTNDGDSFFYVLKENNCNDTEGQCAILHHFSFSTGESKVVKRVEQICQFFGEIQGPTSSKVILSLQYEVSEDDHCYLHAIDTEVNELQPLIEGTQKMLSTKSTADSLVKESSSVLLFKGRNADTKKSDVVIFSINENDEVNLNFVFNGSINIKNQNQIEFSQNFAFFKEETEDPQEKEKPFVYVHDMDLNEYRIIHIDTETGDYEIDYFIDPLIINQAEILTPISLEIPIFVENVTFLYPHQVFCLSRTKVFYYMRHNDTMKEFVEIYRPSEEKNMTIHPDFFISNDGLKLQFFLVEEGKDERQSVICSITKENQISCEKVDVLSDFIAAPLQEWKNVANETIGEFKEFAIEKVNEVETIYGLGFPSIDDKEIISTNQEQSSFQLLLVDDFNLFFSESANEESFLYAYRPNQETKKLNLCPEETALVSVNIIEKNKAKDNEFFMIAVTKNSSLHMARFTISKKDGCFPSCFNEGTIDQKGCLNHQCECAEHWSGPQYPSVVTCNTCIPNYYGMQCDAFCLWNVTCNGRGNCKEDDGSCICNRNGSEDQYFKEHSFCGECKEGRNINSVPPCSECEDGKAIPKSNPLICSAFKCLKGENGTEKVKFSSPYACSTHGECVDENVCVCERNYFGMACGVTSCNGILSNDTSKVCNGNGNCYEYDKCNCNGDDYEGSFCETKNEGKKENVSSQMIIWIATFIAFSGIVILLLLSFAGFFFIFLKKRMKKEGKLGNSSKNIQQLGHFVELDDFEEMEEEEGRTVNNLDSKYTLNDDDDDNDGDGIIYDDKDFDTLET